MKLLSLLILFVAVCICEEEIKAPNFSFKQYRGYIEVNEQRHHNLFYWMMESKRSPYYDPIILWMQGGPGKSGAQALFFENGPFHLVSLGYNITWEVLNDFSWNNVANVIYVDQPIGTGFSYSDFEQDYFDLKEDAIMEEMLTFLVKLFLKYPQYQHNDLYLFGEAYAGHFIPVLSRKIMERNAKINEGKEQGKKMNLKGIGVGNGWVSPIIQYESFITYAFANKLIGTSLNISLTQTYQYCAKLLRQEDYAASSAPCESIATAILDNNPGLAFWDIRLRCPRDWQHNCYDFSILSKLMAQKWVKKYLGVGDHNWDERTQEMEISMAVDNEKSFAWEIPKLLDAGIRVLIYTGEFDMAGNFNGQEGWTNALDWTGKTAYKNAPRKIWKVENEEAGYYKSALGLTYLFVENAGHLVSMNQPKNSLDMLTKYLDHQFGN